MKPRGAAALAEGRRIGAFAGVVALLHAVGWLVVFREAHVRASFLGFGVSAYLLGLRHAFDADHIAAIDDTIRYRVRGGERPLGVGFFFSLGHASIVLAVTIAMMLAAGAIGPALPSLREYGGIIGTAISGAFLWSIGLLNLAALVRRITAGDRGADSDAVHGRRRSGPRGLIGRLVHRRFRRAIAHSWQMFPLGMLFGLGFDTASEVALLATAAGASAVGAPAPAVLALPVLFAAGMSALDTADGILMTKVYGWAAVDPRRRRRYDLVVTGLSVGVALLIGSIEWLQVAVQGLHAHAMWLRRTTTLDFETLGYVVVGFFLGAWMVALARTRCKATLIDPHPVRRDAAKYVAGGAL